jgi:hypothetical protein
MRKKFTLKEIVESRPLLAELLSMVRANGGADHRFDLNLAEGKQGEQHVLDILSGKYKVEVKRDIKVSKTGNVAIEYECNAKPSGISVTEAEWYAIILDGDQFDQEVIIFISTERLKRLVDNAPGKFMYGGDKGMSCFKLLRLDRLLMEEESIEDYEEWKKGILKSRVKKQLAKV